MKINQLKLFALVVILMQLISCKNSEITSKEITKKTNIVFVLVDDLGYADVGFNGSKYFETPN